MVARLLKSKTAAIALALVCVGVLAFSAAALFPRQIGVDFYQFWGVPLAKRVSGTALSPYVDAAGYAATLNAIVDASADGKLRAVNHLRRALEPMGTPFLYASFAFFPDDYRLSQTLFAIVQHLAAGLAMVLLANLRGIRLWPAIAIAALVELTFNPFAQDVKVGNVNSLQLLYMAVLLHLAVKRREGRSIWTDAILVGSLAPFFIFKPNTLWIAAMLAAHYWIVAGHRRFAAGAGMGLALGAFALILGAWYFGNPGVWGEWLQLARALDGSGLPLTLQNGNLSFAMILSQGSRAYGSLAFGGFVAVCLLLTLYIAMSQTGRRSDLVVPTARAAFSDPWFALSLAVIFTFATSPLVWPHYHLFALVPIYWMFRRNGRWDIGTWGAIVCFVLWSRPVLETVAEADLQGLALALVVFAWIPLVPGVFMYAVEQRRRLEGSLPTR